MSDAAVVDAQIALADAVAEWCRRNALSSLRRSRRDDAAQWCRLASETRLDFGSRFLVDETIERAFAEPAGAPRPAQVAGHRPTLRWLHVFSISYLSGGHTALARRWIEFDPTADTHDVVFTHQTLADASPALLNAVSRRGGTSTALLPELDSVAARAERLRSIASGYDAVVLHVHMWDPVPLMSFGTSGGPPVLLVNHADHVFWLGASIADRVINIRPSGETVCLENRGVDRVLRLPLPLPRTLAETDVLASAACRERLGIPPTATVFLTIGTPYKYRPLPGLSFFEAAEQLLARLPDAHLVAVGPDDNATEWTSLRSGYAPRVHTVGLQLDIRPFIGAADVYLEGFPFGSLTALLEAVVGGLPPVLAPARVPLPYRSDDFALESVPVPQDVDEYVRHAVARAGASATSRDDTLSRVVLQTHCQPGWDDRLAGVRALIASGLRHEVHEITAPEPLDIERARYWTRFLRVANHDNPFRVAFASALRGRLRPTVDLALARALSRARAVGVGVAHPVTAAIGSRVLSMVPHRTALKYYVGE